MANLELKLREFIENEARSCLMEELWFTVLD